MPTSEPPSPRSSSAQIDSSQLDPTHRDSGRLVWVDHAKAVGISLVVIGHLIRSMINSGIAPRGPVLEFLDGWIYSFHMPLFFALSGLFATSLRGPFRTFLSGKLRTIAYPYLLWSGVQTGIQVVLSNYTNSTASLGDLWAIPYRPFMQFWFLHALFLIFVLAKILQMARIRSAAILALALGSFYFYSIAEVPYAPIRAVAHNFVYFAFGAFIGPVLLARAAPMVAARALPAAILGLSLPVICVHWNYAPPKTIALVAALSGICGTLALCVLTARWRFSWLTIVGQRSLEIFVSHTLAMAGARIVLVHLLKIQNPWVHWPLGLAMGLGAPLILAAVLKRMGLRHGFTWPKKTLPQPAVEGQPSAE